MGLSFAKVAFPGPIACSSFQSQSRGVRIPSERQFRDETNDLNHVPCRRGEDHQARIRDLAVKYGGLNKAEAENSLRDWINEPEFTVIAA